MFLPFLVKAQTNLSNNLQPNVPKSLDNRTGKVVSGVWQPYASVNEANSLINGAYRYKGLTVLVNVGGISTEYWYRDGVADNDLIVKSAGGGTDTTGFGLATRKQVHDSTQYLRELIANSGDSLSRKYITRIIDSVQQFYTLPKDTSVIIYVKDNIRTSGKAFVWRPNGTRFVDSAITYPASGTGQWTMLYPGNKYYITWFGAVPNDSSKDATRLIQKAIDRAFADSIYVVGIPKGRFYIKGSLPPVIPGQSTDSFLRYNQQYQIQIPLETDFGSQKRLTIEGDFEGSSASPLDFLSTAPGFQSGCVLESTIRPDPSLSAAVIGSRAYIGAFSAVSYTALKIENVIILVNAGSSASSQQVTMSGINATYASQCQIDNVTVGVNIPYNTVPSWHSNTIGVKMPHNLNFATSIIGNLRVYGFYRGIVLGEHTLANYLTCVSSHYGLSAPNTGHRISVTKYQAEGCYSSIFMNEQGEGLYIASFGEEKGGLGWTSNVYTVETSSGAFLGNALFISQYVNSGTIKMRVLGNPDFVHVAYCHWNDVENGYSYESRPNVYGDTVNHIDGLFAKNLNLVGTTSQRIDFVNLQTGQNGEILFRQNSDGTKQLFLPSSIVNYADVSIPIEIDPDYAIDTTPNSITTVKYRYDGKTMYFSTL